MLYEDRNLSLLFEKLDLFSKFKAVIFMLILSHEMNILLFGMTLLLTSNYYLTKITFWHSHHLVF